MDNKSLLVAVCLVFLSISSLIFPIFNSAVSASVSQLQVVKTIEVGDNVNGLVVNEEMNRLYVGTDNGLLIYDCQTDTLITKILLGSRINALALNPQTNRLYVATDDEVDSACVGVYVIDCATNQKVGEIPEMVHDQFEIAVNPVTNLIYIPFNTLVLGVFDVINVYSGETNSLVASVDIPGSNESEYVQDSGVAVNPVTNMIYVFETGAPYTLSMIDGDSNQVIKTIVPPNYCLKVLVNPCTNYVYLDWCVLDGETLDEVSLPYLPLGGLVAFDTVNNLILVSGGDVNADLSVLDGNTHDLIASLKFYDEEGLFFYPDYGAVNSNDNKFYVADQHDSLIQVVTLVELEPTEPSPSPSPSTSTTLSISSSPMLTPTPSPSVPEFPIWITLVLILSSIAVIIFKKRKRKQNE